MKRNKRATAPSHIDAKVIDDVTSKLLPEIQRQLQEENDRTAEQLKRAERTASELPTARVFTLAQGNKRKKEG